MTYEPVSVESLLTHQDWALRLARRLVHEDGEAEDLVQRTWVAALRHPPDSERGARAWIRKVLLNLARERHRRSKTREHHERSFPGAVSDVPDALEVLSREEIRKLLSEQLLELDEPYRTVVLQRYYDGLSSVEIARRLGIPAGTVRWRLKVGLDQLRDLLDRRSGGDRSRWVSALLLFTAPGSKPAAEKGTATETAVAPALLGAPSWIALAGAGALGVFFLARGLEHHAGDSGGPGDATDAVHAGLVAAHPTPGAGDDVARTATSGERSPVLSDAGPASAFTPDGLRILVVDESGAPMSAARILVASAGGYEERARSDAEGRASLAVRPGDPGALGIPATRGRVGVRALAEGREASPLVHVAPPFTAAHEVRLVVGGPEMRLTGRVLDRQGRAIPGAVVAWFNAGKRLEHVSEGDFASPSYLSAESDAEGGFVLANLARAGSTLGCFAPGFAFSSRSMESPSGLPIEFVLERGARLSGTVRWPDGRPAANVSVGCEPALKSAEWATGLPRYDAHWNGFGETTQTDENGRFLIEGVKAGRARLLWAHDESTGLVASTTRRPENDREEHWDAVLSERTGFRLRLLDETGEALCGWVVHIRCPLEEGSWWIRQRATDAEGRLRITDCPDAQAFLDVFSPDDAGASYASRQLEPSADEVVVQVETHVTSSVSGCLLDALGEPQPGGRLLFHSLRTTLKTPVARDERGNFEQRLASGAYWLLFQLERTTVRVKQFMLAPSERRELGMLTLPPMGALRLDPTVLGNGTRAPVFSLFSLGEKEGDRSVLRVTRGVLESELLLPLYVGRYRLLAFDGSGANPKAHEFHIKPHIETRLDPGR